MRREIKIMEVRTLRTALFTLSALGTFLILSGIWYRLFNGGQNSKYVALIIFGISLTHFWDVTVILIRKLRLKVEEMAGVYD